MAFLAAEPSTQSLHHKYMKNPKICIGICIKHLGKDLLSLIKSCPKGLTFVIVSGQDENLDTHSLPQGNNYKFFSIPDCVYGYDLIRNRKRVFDEFMNLDVDLLLYLDDDEFFPASVNEFSEFYKSSANVGMLTHENIYFGTPHHFCGKSFHARLLKKGEFPLSGKIIESVKQNQEQYYLRTTIPHDFCRRGFEDFFSRASRWAKESAANFISHDDNTMRKYMPKVRQKLGLLSPFARFFYHYVIQRGFTKGLSGYYISMNYAISEYMRLAYIFEVKKTTKARKES